MASQPPNAPQAKILQGRTLRTLVAVVIVGAALLGLRWYQTHKSDITGALGGPVDSAGMVSAIEYGDSGDHVVVFNDKGEKIQQGEIKPNVRDTDPVWSPGGQRIFFASNRDGKSYQLYRWRPVPGGVPEVRSLSSQGKSHPSFPVGATGDDEPILLISGGFVVEYNPSDLKGHQLLPPAIGVTQAQDQGEGSGSTSQFSGIYGQLGDRFRIARWQKGTDALVAVMGSDQGEVLIYQDLTANGPTMKPPVPIGRATHFDFDISPKDGSVVFTAQNFLWDPATKVPPQNRFRHAVMIWRPDNKVPSLLLPSKDDSIAFGEVSISPSGDKFLVVEGNYDRTSETLQSKMLLEAPTEGNAIAGSAKLVEGDVHEPTWNPKGDAVAYAKRGSNGSRAIYVSAPDGSNEHTLTGDVGSFGYPLFSPQVKQGK